MAKKKKVRVAERGIDMTPMIDVVFQLIIFFIITVNLDKELKKIELADSPEGPPILEKVPETVIITVDRRGVITVGVAVMSPTDLHRFMRNVVAQDGFGVPVLLRGDKEARHQAIRRVMDVCASVGLWKIKFAAMKERA